MAKYLPLVVSLVLLGIVSVCPYATENVAKMTEIIHADLSDENVKTVQEVYSQGGRSSRLIRGLPDPDKPFSGRWHHEPTAEQLAAKAKMDQERLKREEEERARKAAAASRQLAREEEARKRGQKEQENIQKGTKSRRV